VLILTWNSGYTIRDLPFNLIVIDEAHRLIKDNKFRNSIVVDIQKMINENKIHGKKQIMLSGTSINLYNYPDFKFLKFVYKEPKKIDSWSFDDK